MGLFGKKVTTGYKYKLGMHLLLCHGPIDGVLQIWVGDKQAWPLERPWWAKTNNLGNGEVINITHAAGAPVEKWTLTCAFGDEGPAAVFYVEGSISGVKANATSGVAYNNGIIGFTITDGTAHWMGYGLPGDILYVTGGATDGYADEGCTSARVDNTSLFGGEEQEGGVLGTVDIEYGLTSQTANSYLSGFLGSVPAFRHLVGLVLRCAYLGTSAYIKPWSVLAKRTNIRSGGDTQWYSAKATIGEDMNPAHIIRECLTDSMWGLGFGVGYIDADSFESAADTLYTEGLGLSCFWDSQTPISTFLADICDHIDGALYQDLSSGKFKLVLARDDYTPAALDTYDESDIVALEDYERPTLGRIVNEVTVVYHDRANNKDASLTVNDIAMIDRQGGRVVSQTLQFPAICEGTVANMIAQRELTQFTAAAATMTIHGTRAMSGIRPCDVFKIDWPALGITGMVVRALEIDLGTLEEGKVVIKAVEDIFALGSALFATPGTTEWSSPATYPVDATYRLLFETPYFTLARDLFGDSLAGSMAANAGYLGVAAAPPSGDSFAYILQCRDNASDTWRDEGIKAWTPSATIGANLSLNITDVSVSLVGGTNLDAVEVDTYAVIGSECLKVLTISTTTNTVTLARAVLDTVPTVHTLGDRIWFVGSEMALVDREYTAVDAPRSKVLSMTTLGTLEDGGATEDTATAFDARAYRPYPPSDVKVNGVSYPVSFTGELIVSWKHRDRTQQTASIIEQTGTSVGPEAGTTYTLLIYDQSNNLVRTETGLGGTSYTYADADERSDCGFGPGDLLNTLLRFVLYSVRSGYDSWQSHDITVDRVQASSSPSGSASSSPSASPSATPSASVSASPSTSESASPSTSPSASVSASPSASVSSSPSAP